MNGSYVWGLSAPFGDILPLFKRDIYNRDVPIPKFEPIPVPILNFKAKPIQILILGFFSFKIIYVYIRRFILKVTHHEQATPKQLIPNLTN